MEWYYTFGEICRIIEFDSQTYENTLQHIVITYQICRDGIEIILLSKFNKEENMPPINDSCSVVYPIAILRFIKMEDESMAMIKNEINRIYYQVRYKCPVRRVFENL